MYSRKNKGHHRTGVDCHQGIYHLDDIKTIKQGGALWDFAINSCIKNKGKPT